MAVEFKVQGTRTSEYLFLPGDVVVDAECNGRHDLPDIQWLIESILKVESMGGHGQIQPVSIRRTGGDPVLCAGFSRWRAVSAINKDMLLWVDGAPKKRAREKPMALRCSYSALNEKQAFIANIEENRVRNMTKPMDDAYNIQRLVNVHQMAENEIADIYHESARWIRGRLALIEATPEVEKQIRAGKIKGPAAQAIAKLSKEHQKNLAKVAEEKGKVTAADVRRETGEAPKAKKSETTAVNGIALKPIAVSLAYHVIKDDLTFQKLEALAKEVLEAAGEEL
jgi:hypothetical protein